MESLQPSEEMEQSLMDLGPFLGVSIKEEVVDETQDNRIQNNKSGETSGGVAVAQSSGTAGEEGMSASKESNGEGNATVAAEGGSAGPWVSLTCVFCSQPLHSTEGTPHLMECLHSACDGCLTTKFKEKAHEYNLPETNETVTIQCPRCSVKCTLGGVIDQQFVLEKREASSGGSAGGGGNSSADQRCSSCSDDNAATAWCCECAEYICDVCVQAHQRLKITKDHTIKSKEEAMNENQASASGGGGGSQDMYCKEHNQEKLSLFCETCDRLTCRDCQLLRHRDHRYQFSSEMAGPAREAIAGLLAEVSYKRVLLGSAMKVIHDRQTLIADKKKALVHEITQTVVKLTNAINTRGKQLVLQLNEVCDSKQKTLNEKKVALEQLSAITDHCIEFVNAALEQGSDTAILYSKKQVTSHLQRIKSRRADIPNPEIPVRIHLALEKVPDLIKVMSAIGAVVVDGKVHPLPGGTAAQGQVAGAPGAQAAGQGPYHPPAPSPSATTALQAMHHAQQQILGGVTMSGAGQQRSGQPSPSPHPPQSQQQFNAQQQQQSQLAHLTQMSAQLQRQNTSAAVNPLAGVIPQMRGAAGAAGSMIRHPHVTSSTHPHHMAAASVEGMNYLQGMQQELNLRGLLSASPSGTYQHQQQQQQHQQRAAAAAAMQGQFSRQALHAMQTYQGASGYNQQNNQVVGAMYANAAASGRAGAGSRGSSVSPHTAHPHNMYQQMQQQHTQQQQQQQQQQHAAQQAQHASAKWHIPQSHTNGLGGGGMYTESGGGGVGVQPSQQQQQQHVMGVAGGDASFKITIRQPPRTTPAVTSTNPKTPSPNLHGMNMTEAVTNSMDKLCQDSVNDLMATIAKLDSNGVQVLAESGGGRGGAGKGASPLVHSSTDDVTPPPSDKGAVGVVGGVSGPERGSDNAADPNEDWCAVCMDGGELMCCDKCPKVFHQYCHIPVIDKLPDEAESWQCLLCVNFADIPELAPGEKRGPGLTIKQQNIIQRVVLELYCQYEASLHFREPVPEDNVDYHSKIKRPMALDTIRLKLQPNNPNQYTHVSQLVSDCRLMFSNALIYNPPDSVIYKDAKRLEEFFEQQLVKWLPVYAYGGTEIMEDQIGGIYKRPRLASGGATVSIPVD